jgi:hypothetical protein
MNAMSNLSNTKKIRIFVFKFINPVLFCFFLFFNTCVYSQNNTYQIGRQMFSKDCSDYMNLRNHYVAIKVGNKWGLCDPNWILITPIIFQKVYGFIDGNKINMPNLMIVLYEGKKGMIDEKGNYVIQPKYDELSTFNYENYTIDEGQNFYRYIDNDVTIYRNSNLVGYVDINGREITPPIFSDYTFFTEGVAVAKKNNKYGMIDKTGKTIIPFKYNNFYSYLSNGYNCTAFINEQGLCGFYNKDGKLIIPFSKQKIFTPENTTFSFGSSNSIDNIPPAVLIDGKPVLIKNVERFSPNYEIRISNYSLNHENFNNSFLQKNLSLIKSIYNSPTTPVAKKNTLITKYEPFVKNDINSTNSYGQSNTIITSSNSNSINASTNNSSLKDIKHNGYGVNEWTRKLFDDMYADVIIKYSVKSMFNQNADAKEAQNVINQKTIEIKNKVEGWVGGSMNKSQLAEFNEIKKNSEESTIFGMKLMTESMNNSLKDKSSFYTDNSEYYDSWQCEKCGQVSRSTRPPDNYMNSCPFSSTDHSWHKANTNHGWKCNRCGVQDYILHHNNRRPKGPFEYELGSCLNGKKHSSYGSWTKF